MNFIFDPSLVLYLPLYELDGNSFASRDKHGHLCTATGALWTPQGRSFDGIDDYLTLPVSTCWNFSGDFTVIIWVKPDTLNRNLIKSVSNEDWSLATNNDWAFNIGGDGNLNFYVKGSAAMGGSSAIDVGRPTMVSVRRCSGSASLIKDAEQTGPSYANSLSLGNTQTLEIGRNEVNLDLILDGMIGEIWLFNRALTFLEVQRHYLATKSRYR